MSWNKTNSKALEEKVAMLKNANHKIREELKQCYKKIAELEEAMKPKSCYGCKQSWERNNQTFHKYYCDYLQRPTHGDFCCNRYEPKEQ